jgi:ATP-dependent DNA helicase RecG
MKLSKVENQNIEFKQSWRDEYLKWICAFANTDGGILYIGVKDNGEIFGVEESHKLTEDIPNKIRNTMGLICDVKLQKDNDLEYFEIVVEKYPFPVSYHGKYYKRTGSTIQELTGIELDKMILYVQGRTWDSIPIPNIKIDDLESDAFKLFRKKASDSGRLDKESLEVTNETLLQNLHLFEGENLNRAAILAFHPDPEKWVTGAYVKIAYFENEADILYQDEIHGPLLLQVEKTMELIYSKYMKALISYDDIYRKETFFFPRAAFRELLLNAVIHKDYLSTTPIQIRIYKDKIRLWNDGGLPKEVPLENLFKEHISKPCNPNLANVFFKCGMIESWGRGFEKNCKLLCRRKCKITRNRFITWWCYSKMFCI